MKIIIAIISGAIICSISTFFLCFAGQIVWSSYQIRRDDLVILTVSVLFSLIALLLGGCIGHFKPRPHKVFWKALIISVCLEILTNIWWIVWATYFSTTENITGKKTSLGENIRLAFFWDAVPLLIACISLSLSAFLAALIVYGLAKIRADSSND